MIRLIYILQVILVAKCNIEILTSPCADDPLQTGMDGDIDFGEQRWPSEEETLYTLIDVKTAARWQINQLMDRYRERADNSRVFRHCSGRGMRGNEMSHFLQQSLKLDYNVTSKIWQHLQAFSNQSKDAIWRNVSRSVLETMCRMRELIHAEGRELPNLVQVQTHEYRQESRQRRHEFCMMFTVKLYIKQSTRMYRRYLRHFSVRNQHC